MGARVLLRIFLRTYVVGATFNTKGMQNVGFALVMEPGLVDLYGHDPAALQRARSRYLKHYNTHPFWTPLLAGIFLSMEKKIASGLLPADILLKLRSTTVYTLSALGDSFSAAAPWSCGPWSGSIWPFRGTSCLLSCGFSSVSACCRRSKSTPLPAAMPRACPFYSASSPGTLSIGGSASRWPMRR